MGIEESTSGGSGRSALKPTRRRGWRPAVGTIAAVGVLAASLMATACSSSHGSPSASSLGSGSSSGAGSRGSSGNAGAALEVKCSYLKASDFSAIGKAMHGAPVFNYQPQVDVGDCYYDLGSENDLVYLDFFSTPTAGEQYYTNATDPSVGGGAAVDVTGVGDSAYWVASGDTLFAKKGATVFQLKLSESGKSAAQLQADATVLATKVAGRI